MIFGRNGGFGKRKRVIFAEMGDSQRENVIYACVCDFRKENPCFLLKWGICVEKTRDFCLSGGFAK